MYNKVNNKKVLPTLENISALIIQNNLSQKDVNERAKILKEGLDTRDEGLSWIIIRLIELNVHIDYSLFPDFLDLQHVLPVRIML